MGKKWRRFIVYKGTSLPFYEVYPVEDKWRIFSDPFGKIILCATRSCIWWALCRCDCKGFKHVGIACRYEPWISERTLDIFGCIYKQQNELLGNTTERDENNEDTGRALARQFFFLLSMKGQMLGLVPRMWGEWECERTGVLSNRDKYRPLRPRMSYRLNDDTTIT